jgi:hypothetical protein
MDTHANSEYSTWRLLGPFKLHRIHRSRINERFWKSWNHILALMLFLFLMFISHVTHIIKLIMVIFNFWQNECRSGPHETLARRRQRPYINSSQNIKKSGANICPGLARTVPVAYYIKLYCHRYFTPRNKIEFVQLVMLSREIILFERGVYCKANIHDC